MSGAEQMEYHDGYIKLDDRSALVARIVQDWVGDDDDEQISKEQAERARKLVARYNMHVSLVAALVLLDAAFDSYRKEYNGGKVVAATDWALCNEAWMSVSAVLARARNA